METRWFQISSRTITRMLLGFYLLAWVFPTIRLLLIGAHASASWLELILSAIPDMAILLMYSATALAIHQQVGWRKFIASFNGIDKMFLVFVLFNVLWGAWRANDLVIAGYGFRLTYFATGFYLIGKLLAADSDTRIENFLKNFFLLTVIFASLSWLIYFFYPEVNARMTAIMGGQELAYFIIRMSAFVWSPTVFGTLMAMAATWFLYRAYHDLDAANFICFAITFSCLVMSVSRGPILAYTITFVMLAVLFHKNYKSNLAALLVMGLALFFIDWYLALGGKLFYWLLGSTFDTLSLREGLSRVELWERSFAAFVANPMGYGLGKAGHVALRFTDTTTGPVVIYATDGWFLKIACETGIVGLILYLVAAAAYFFRAAKFVWNQRHTVVTFILIIFLQVNATAVVSNTLDYFPFITLFWLLVGFSAQRVYHYQS